MTMSDDNENEQPLNLDIPDHLEYSAEHAWVDRSVDPAIIGITEYAADQLGELVFVDLPEPGARVEAGDEIVACDTLYGCTYALLNHGICKFGVKVHFIGQRRSVRRRLAAEGRA